MTRRVLFSLAVALCCALSALAAEEKGRFLVLTDVHIADDYVVGSAPKTFCTAGTGKAGEHGYYNCDTPEATFLSSLRFSQSVGPYEFVLWLGDSPTKYLEHPQHNQTTAHVMENVRRVAEHIRARGLRPAENGLGGGGAGIVVRPDVSRMSRADRAALAARAERGERVKLSL